MNKLNYIKIIEKEVLNTQMLKPPKLETTNNLKQNIQKIGNKIFKKLENSSYPREKRSSHGTDKHSNNLTNKVRGQNPER